MNTMRAKVVVGSVTPQGEHSEELSFNAVCKSDGYPEDGSDEDNTYARYTPSLSLKIQIANPNLLGKFKQGDKFYLDFTPAS